MSGQQTSRIATGEVAPERRAPTLEGLAIEDQLCFALYQASHLVIGLYRPLLEKLGLTYPQYLVLLALWEESPRTIGQLGETLALDSNTLAPLLGRMEQAGLIRRTRDLDDKRRILVSLTAEGQAVQSKVHATREAVVCELDEHYPEYAELRRQLQAMNRSLLAARKGRDEA